MEKKQFEAESKRLLDLMINSIYTNKEIFLRELISNASDAIDKLYYISLTDNNVKLNKSDFKIEIIRDEINSKLIIKDNGIGMNKEELEKNLGTIACSGTLKFKEDNLKKEDINVIGQFGVGFYSAFMVSNKVTVESKKYGENTAYRWESEGADGYIVEECEKEDVGTTITLDIKKDTQDESYSQYLDRYRVENLIKKYSDYIRYPIIMNVTRSKKREDGKAGYEQYNEDQTINSMIPLWKKNKKDITDEEYTGFYTAKFLDFQKPLKVIHTKAEGTSSYSALLYIPSHLPYDYYDKTYERGLQLYSNGVLIMDKCKDLIPTYYGFMKGIVDSEDLSLNISREMLQQDRQLKTIAKGIEKKITKELLDMQKDAREEYEKVFETYGTVLKYGAYEDYGENKEVLKDLLMFYSSSEKKLVTLKEYVSRMKEGEHKIYYACGETVDKIDLMPQVELIKEKGIEILYLTESVDEFVFKVLEDFEGKKFANIADNDVDLDTEEEKEKLNKENEENKSMLDIMKETLAGHVNNVRFTHRLKNHPVCLTSEGMVSTQMEKVINAMPTDQNVKAEVILEINSSHKIAEKLKQLYSENKTDEIKDYAKILLAQAKLIEGMNVENPTEISNLICELIAK